jgi:hypothetical protein
MTGPIPMTRHEPRERFIPWMVAGSVVRSAVSRLRDRLPGFSRIEGAGVGLPHDHGQILQRGHRGQPGSQQEPRADALRRQAESAEDARPSQEHLHLVSVRRYRRLAVGRKCSDPHPCSARAMDAGWAICAETAHLTIRFGSRPDQRYRSAHLGINRSPRPYAVFLERDLRQSVRCCRSASNAFTATRIRKGASARRRVHSRGALVPCGWETPGCQNHF